jgi:hypothetical protein
VRAPAYRTRGARADLRSCRKSIAHVLHKFFRMENPVEPACKMREKDKMGTFVIAA